VYGTATRKRENAMDERKNACYGNYNVSCNARERERKREKERERERERERELWRKNAK